VRHHFEVLVIDEGDEAAGKSDLFHGRVASPAAHSPTMAMKAKAACRWFAPRTPIPKIAQKAAPRNRQLETTLRP
jgi:hypothetical protein